MLLKQNSCKMTLFFVTVKEFLYKMPNNIRKGGMHDDKSISVGASKSHGLQ